jgi:hypothetical protein
MIVGGLLGESMRSGSVLEGLPLRVRRISRYDLAEPGPGQPGRWTMLEFETDDEQAGPLATALAGCLLAEGGWYCDFHTATEKFVVFAERIFRYRRDDEAGHSAAVAYGRSVGVPEAQLDWTR